MFLQQSPCKTSSGLRRFARQHRLREKIQPSLRLLPDRNRDVSLGRRRALAVLVGHGPGKHFPGAAAVPASKPPEADIVNVPSAPPVDLFAFDGKEGNTQD